MNVINNPPVVKIGDVDLINSKYVRSNGDYWRALTLTEYCKNKNYPVFKLPLAAIDLASTPWKEITNIDGFLFETKRTLNALDFPILLDYFGGVCDGWHRICKAILDGKTEVDAIRIEEMPLPDGNTKEQKETKE